MRDERKTKAQLIDELKQLRQRMDGTPSTAAERALAAERVRAEVLSMRASDDLLKVVGMMYRALVDLDVQPLGCTFHFIDEDAGNITCYAAAESFQKYGFSSLLFSSEIAEIDEDIAVAGSTLSIAEFLSLVTSCPPDLVERWHAGEPWSAPEIAAETRHMRENLEQNPELEQHPFFRDGIVTHVPFPFGTVALKARTFEKEHVAIVQSLTEALSLGYVRFLDYQRLEEQNLRLSREAAVERVRAAAMSMRSSEDLLDVVATMYRELLSIDPERSWNNIDFIDEETDQVIVYTAQRHPSTFGITWSLPAMREYGNEVIAYINYQAKLSQWNDQIRGCWNRREAGRIVFDMTRENFESDLKRLEVKSASSAAYEHFLGEHQCLALPFQHGVIELVQRQEINREDEEVTRLFSEALSLGFVRFLDFQKIEQARQKLIDDLEEELQTAHEMQMNLMPTEPPKVEGLDIAGRCLTANHVGGDFFHYFPQDGKLSLSLADVTGHAMEAAIPAVMFDGILKTERRSDAPRGDDQTVVVLRCDDEEQVN